MEKTRFDIEDTTVEHLEELASQLRYKDLQEIKACSEMGVLETLVTVFNRSDEVRTVFLNGDIIGVYSLTLTLETDCSFWFLGTDSINKCSLSFLKESRKMLKELLNKYRCVFSLVYSENKISIKWLEWLGFSVSKEVELLGPMSSTFYRVSIEGV